MLLLDIYQDRKGEWRWRGKRGGNIVATCHEGYTRRSDAKRAWKRFSEAMRAGRWMQAEPFIRRREPLRQRAKRLVEAVAPADATRAEKKRAVDKVVRRLTPKPLKRKGSRR